MKFYYVYKSIDPVQIDIEQYEELQKRVLADRGEAVEIVETDDKTKEVVGRCLYVSPEYFIQ